MCNSIDSTDGIGIIGLDLRALWDGFILCREYIGVRFDKRKKREREIPWKEVS